MAGLKGVVRVDGREVQISRPEKVLFPEDGITKGELIEYYARNDIPTVSVQRGSFRRRCHPTFQTGSSE
jgi:bifunctional non-homologous end joining protein LigD